MEDVLLVKSAIAINSVAVFIFVIWFISAKIAERRSKADQQERERQLETLLKHSQDQFDKAIAMFESSNKGSEDQFNKIIEVINRTNDRFYSIQQENVKFNSVLTETITRMDMRLKYSIKFKEE